MRPDIREWLTGKDVFITGATGFMGKILVEKLLRSCHGIGNIYLLIRSKRGMSAQTRWENISNSPLWERLKAENATALEKIIVIPGDVSFDNLGISDTEREILTENISVVFHAAASVRFDDMVSKAILLNLKGTSQVVNLAKSMKKLEHVSTTYCNANKDCRIIEEKVYEQDLDWRKLVEMAEREECVLNILIKKILGRHPNTYTLSKSLAEIVVKEASSDIPAVIFRPSVVVGCLREPVEGWMDNFNGPVGVTTGVSKGVLRTFKANPDVALDYVTVDIAINSMIVTAWHKATNLSRNLEIYNCAYADKVLISFKEMVKCGVDVNHTLPMDNNIWYPFIIVTNNRYYYHILFYLLEFIPAIILDSLLVLARKRPILVKLYIKIYLAAEALSVFTSKEMVFDSKYFRAIWDLVPEGEKDIFFLDPMDVTGRECMFKFQSGAKKYLLNEKDSDLDALIAKHWRLYYLDRFTKLFFVGFCGWYIISIFNYFFV